MSELKKSIVVNGQRVIVEMTDSEIEQYEKDQAEALKLATEHSKAAAAKANLLSKLGITEEEAKLLLS